MQGYYMSVGIYVTIAVYEREKKIVDVLRVRGLDWWYYWLANFIVDFTFYNINLIILQFIVGDINFIYMDLFGVAMILYCYCCSFCFKTLKGAIGYFPIMNFLFGSFIPLVGFIEVNRLKDILLWLLTNLYPFYSLQKQLLPDPTHPLTQTGPQYYYFVLQICFYLGLLACIEFDVYRRLFKKEPYSTCYENIKLDNVSKNYGQE